MTTEEELEALDDTLSLQQQDIFPLPRAELMAGAYNALGGKPPNEVSSSRLFK